LGAPSPDPAEKISEVDKLFIGNPCDTIGELSLRIDIVALCGVNQRRHGCRSFAASLGTGEWPSLAASLAPHAMMGSWGKQTNHPVKVPRDLSRRRWLRRSKVTGTESSLPIFGE
jgi:hypothetical protein